MAAAVYLHEIEPRIRHFVIATEDDVVEILSAEEPVWEEIDAATTGTPLPGKARHLYIGEDDEEIERLIEDVQRRQKRDEAG